MAEKGFESQGFRWVELSSGESHDHIVSRLLIREKPAMLVLNRKEEERILIGDSVVVTIIRVAGDRVKIGIEAPQDVRVIRGELEKKPSRPQK